MKILFLDHPQYDTGAFCLWAGLCDILGPNNVIVFPPKKLYYGNVDYHNEGYIAYLRDIYVNQKLTLPHGIPPLQQGEDIINGYPTHDTPYFVVHRGQPEYTEDDIVDMIKSRQFGLIVLASGHRANTIALARLRDKFGGGNIGMNNLPPLVYLDAGERDEVNQHWIHLYHPKIIFKSVLTPEVYQEMKNRYGWNIYALPHSSFLAGKNLRTVVSEFNLRDAPERVRENTPDFAKDGVPDSITFNDNDKVIDIFYAFGPTYDKRAELIRTIDGFINNHAYIGIKKRTDEYHGFLDTIAHSRIAVSMRGSGRDTTRYWDIPLFRTLMLCDGTMGAIHPYPFEHGKTAIFYDENRLNDIPGILQYYLEHEKERRTIAEAGFEHIRKYHTNAARATYFLEIVGKELGQSMLQVK